MLDRPTADPHAFSLTEARHVIKDLFKPNPWIYWTDFLLSYSAALFFYAMVRRLPDLIAAPTPVMIGLRLVSFVISCLLIYRCVMFIHELIHIRSGTFTAFRVVWNLLAGVPFLVPSFIYYTHIDHHRRKHYGTEEDGEYLSLSHSSPWSIFWFIALSPVVPLLGVFRFLVLTPLTWVCPPFRRWVHQHASSMIIDPTYLRPLPPKKTIRIIFLQEFLAFLFCAGVAVSVVLVGQWPFPFLLQAYCTGVFIITINAIRTLGAHRWTNQSDREMTFFEQLEDTVNYPSLWNLSGLWAPIGTRFHALHHLFPSLPYHNMPEAHRRLSEHLPADSAYHRTEQKSLIMAIVDLTRRSQEATRERRTAKPEKVAV
jgi:fatty acid desaturase